MRPRPCRSRPMGLAGERSIRAAGASRSSTARSVTTSATAACGHSQPHCLGKGQRPLTATRFQAEWLSSRQARRVAVRWLSSSRETTMRYLHLLMWIVPSTALAACGGQAGVAGSGMPDAGVIVKLGAGPAPTPQGGAIASGSYVLVAETIYGPLPPSIFNLGIGSPGDAVSAQITVTGDMYSQAFQIAGEGSSGGGQYGPLVPAALSVSQLSAWDGSTPYTANGLTLSLIMVHLYGNPGVVLGAYTVVDDYVLASGSASASAPQRLTGHGPTVVPQARDPRCPMALPDAGTACDPSAGPLECEYGGDSLGRCTQSTACALQTDGSYRFQSYPSSGCDPNPTDCPASYDAAAATSQIIADAGYCELGDEFFCNYPEGLCNCGSAASTLACRCIAPGYASGYGVQQAADGGNACPAQRPLSGAGCNSEGLWCLYADACSRGFSIGPSMACIRGYWERLDLSHSCPATPRCS